MNDCDGLPWHSPRRAEVEVGDTDGRFRALELAIQAGTPSVIKRTEWECVRGGGDVEGVTFGDDRAAPGVPDADREPPGPCVWLDFGGDDFHMCTLTKGHEGPHICGCKACTEGGEG